MIKTLLKNIPRARLGRTTRTKQSYCLCFYYKKTYRNQIFFDKALQSQSDSDSVVNVVL